MPSTAQPEPSPHHDPLPRRVWGAAGVGLVATLLSLTGLNAGAGVRTVETRSPTATVASPTAGVRLADWRTDPYGGSTTSPRGDGSGAAGSTVDSDPATAAESSGVVLIDTVLGQGSGAGAGTGIVLSADGQVLTNYHVVAGATSIRVTVASTGTSYTAEVVGHSESGDVALLQLADASGLTTAEVDDDTVATGDDVTAVGNAGGTGELTAAEGTVTALGETITTADGSSLQGETLEGLIETDADVVAGDSGGPLLDDEGEVVGIDTAASSGSVIDGYAIPIGTALAVVAQIHSGEETSAVQVGASGFLGVQVLDGPTAYTYGYGRQDTAYGPAAGAGVAAVVTGSPADQAGLVAGDTITTIGGTAVTSADQVSTLLGGHDAGDTVTLGWTDGSGSPRTADVTLSASPVA